MFIIFSDVFCMIFKWVLSGEHSACLSLEYVEATSMPVCLMPRMFLWVAVSVHRCPLPHCLFKNTHLCECARACVSAKYAHPSVCECMRRRLWMHIHVCVCLRVCLCVYVSAYSLMRISPGTLQASRDEEVLEVKAGDLVLQRRLLLHSGGDASGSGPSQAPTIAKKQAEGGVGLGGEAGLQAGRMVMGRESTVKSNAIFYLVQYLISFTGM